MTSAIITIVASVLSAVSGWLLNGLLKKWMQRRQDAKNEEQVTTEKKRDQEIADQLNKDLDIK